MVVSEEVCAVGAGRVVDLELGLDLVSARGAGVGVRVGAGVHPVGAALHHHLGVGPRRRGEHGLQPRLARVMPLLHPVARG